MTSPRLLQENAPVMHLRNPNQYVQAALGEWGGKHGRLPFVPRTAGQQGFTEDVVTGTYPAHWILT